MYNEKIEQLIKAALADGVLTEKEKQILFKRAQEQEIDLDEFEMVLDARLIELQKSEKEKAAQSAPKSNKLGDVRKCPQCGALIGSFQMMCPECGFEFSGVGPNKFVENFSAEIRKAIENQTDNDTSSLVSMLDTTGMYTDMIKERKLNSAQVKAEILVVKNYPLPSTKEDCIEMLNFMLPKIQVSGSNAATKVWRAKYDAVLQKLQLSAHNNKQILEVVEQYKAQAKISGFGKFLIGFKSLSRLSKIIIGLVIFYVILGVVSALALGL